MRSHVIDFFFPLVFELSSRKGNTSQLNESTSLLPKKTPQLPSEENEPTPTPSWKSPYLLLLLIPVICVSLLLTLALRSFFSSTNSDLFPRLQLTTGSRVYIKTCHSPNSLSRNYLRIESSSGAALATESIPWITGSTFRVEAGSRVHEKDGETEGCWLFRSRATGKFLNFEKESESVGARGEQESDALCFVAVRPSLGSSEVALQDQGSNKWLSFLTDSAEEGGSTLSLIETLPSTSSRDKSHLFELEDIPLLQGVNLGGPPDYLNSLTLPLTPLEQAGSSQKCG
jgi:hypothetical protein